ncbi:cyclopropane-fatty-acyl-phospholipid synthase family protein [Pelagibacteraceae bacterium]|nr:cyclopropane-fatty-acyl-phospholipid synthase family protein [Pelagibacteraceae bacterium]
MLFSVLKKLNFDGTLEIIDSNGKTHKFGNSNPNVCIRLKNKSIERKLFLNPNLHIGEAYMNEELVVEKGTIEEFLNLITNCYDDFISNNKFYKFYEYLSSIFMPFQQINQLVNSKKNVAHHYDINEDLYKLFLDQDMQYSCAYFHNPNMSLDQAQKDKKQHIIKKLQITENMDVLDIGCGWGGMAIEIAKSTGAKVKGITLSENQFKTASERAQKEGLSDKVSFALQDYRNESEKYDRIVSVGMFEHVGVKYFKTYLSKANDILKENGVFLLHTIGQRGKPTATSPWIRKYIFPGGYIPSLSEVMNATQKLNINVTDVEVLRLHYAHTLSKWYQNVIENKDKIINMFDQRFFRMWEFYLLASKYSFVNMGNVVFQIQIAKNINNLPLTRNYIYN